MFLLWTKYKHRQLEEALEKLGATKDECITYSGHGDIMKKSDAPAFTAMLKRNLTEIQEGDLKCKDVVY